MKQNYNTAYFPAIPTLEIYLSQSDALNKLRLLLDGPAHTTEILETKSKRK